MTTLDALKEASHRLVEHDAQREELRAHRDHLVTEALNNGARWTDIEALNLPGLSRGNINKILNRSRA